MNEANYASEGGTPGKIDAIGVDEIQYDKGHNYLTLVYQIDLGHRQALRLHVAWVPAPKVTT